MAQNDLLADVLALPVWDTHNHLDGSKAVCAESFWDLAHYFWFCRELQGVGYPPVEEAMALPEPQRAETFVRAFHAGRNTTWNQAVRRTLRDLWDVEITDAASVLAAGERIAETARRPGWARSVCERLNISRITVGGVLDNGLGDLRALLCVMGQVHLPKLEDLADAATDVIDRLAEGVEAQVADLAAAGRRVVRTAMPAGTAAPELRAEGNRPEDVLEHLRGALFRAMDRRGFHVQVFLGMAAPTAGYRPRTKAHGHYALNDPARIARLHDLFDRYAGCTFELVNAAPLSNLDIVQAARIHPNVVPGGLWWFNFRASTYRQTMQYRLEALPAGRCTLLASDARCIEWLCCKTLVVKRLLAEFLHEQVARGWLGRDDALFVAREWLHDAAERLYRTPPPAAS
ncbi:MAG TPA: glucuronate isomerase [Phycisphaerae bacterium]|nr:glucuronate isomerase [Phycisphaerae bacterium]